VPKIPQKILNGPIKMVVPQIPSGSTKLVKTGVAEVQKQTKNSQRAGRGEQLKQVQKNHSNTLSNTFQGCGGGGVGSSALRYRSSKFYINRLSILNVIIFLKTY
jgi:hypothetical protein